MKRKLKRRLACMVTAALIAFVSVMSTPMGIAAEDINGSDELTRQSFELYPNGEEAEQVVSLDGLMPENAEVTVEDVSGERDALAAFDITITDENNNEFQPDEKAPIYVEITAPEIGTDESAVELWHITDSGEREQITDFTLENGTISFFAAAFSVYEIVERLATPEVEHANTIADLESERGQNGFFIYYKNTNNNLKYISSNILPNNGSNRVLTEVDGLIAASVWHLEKDGDYYRLASDVGGVTKYIYNDTTLNNTNNIGMTENPANADRFEIQQSPISGAFLLRKSDNPNMWLQHSNGGKGIRYYSLNLQDSGNVKNASMYFQFADDLSLQHDFYGINGESYGLMHYNEGSTLGSALMADSAGRFYEGLYQISTVDADHELNMLYVPESGDDITMWTFIAQGEDYYKLRSDDGGYLKVYDQTLQIVPTENEASVLQIKPSAHKTFKLYCEAVGRYVTLDSGGSTYTASGTASEDNNLNFVRKTNVTTEDSLTMTAQRVSVSEGGLGGKELIVYTRIWDEDEKQYKFYAIDHDGTLKQVFAYGDKIMWLDDAENTLLWEYTIYTNPDGSETGYYELRNTFSGLYLAPQISGNQILSGSKIGILMPGRKYKEEPGGTITYGEYYSDIYAWDNGYYRYAAVHADEANGIVRSSSTSRASSFYFATFDELGSEASAGARLHEVTTVDNNEHGIVMKMIDFGVQPGSTSGRNGSVITHEYFNGDDTDGKTRAVPGLLMPMLDANGDPIVNKTTVHSNEDKNFGDAFRNADLVNHLFIQSVYESSGYFEFDSCQNFATLVPGGVNPPGERAPDHYVTAAGAVVDEATTNGVPNTPIYDFTVYRELGTQEGSHSTTAKHGQFYAYNYLTPGVYSVQNPHNLYTVNADRDHANVGLLPDDDPRKYEKLYTVGNSPDFYFGMEMAAQFVQTPSGLDAWGHDIIFEFTGDDDFWLFVDGHLVLDLGGIHSAVGGSVNFRTGQVNVAGQQTTLRELFRQNYRTMNPEKTDAEVDAYLNGVFDDENQDVFTDYTTHQMKIYYMDRGAGASNLHMRFNLSSVTPGDVLFQKELTGVQPEDDMDFSLVQFPIKIDYKVQENEDWIPLSETHGDEHEVSVTYQNSTQTVRFESSYEPPGVNGNLIYHNVFFITPGKNIEIHFPDEAMHYRITECAVNTEIYQGVDTTPNHDLTQHEYYGTVYRDYMTPDSMVSSRPVVSFDNRVKPDRIRSLNITKRLFDESYNEHYEQGVDGPQTRAQYMADHELKYDIESASPDSDVDNTTFNYRLYLSDGYHETMSLADMHRYYVVDPNDHLCCWDNEDGGFVTFDKEGVTFDDATDSRLTEDDRERLTFYTSRYGAISNIPAGYTVRVPGLLVGTRFMVEERDYEIPLGYDLVDFECDTAIINEHQQVEASYEIIDNDPTANDHSEVGQIISTSNAYMFVDNRRGFGVEAEKIWSDRDFSSAHDDIYTAIYLTDRNTPLSGTVRRLQSPYTQVKYFFRQLEQGYTLNDYTIYEVKLTNPVVGADDVVTSYDSIRRLENEEGLEDHGVTGINGGTAQDDYTVLYFPGQPRQTGTGANAVNVRSDSIVNKRRGGVEIYLYEWNNVIDPNDPEYEDIPLEGSRFEIYKQDGTDWTLVGEYTSDKEGLVTILYGLDHEDRFKLVQTYTPKAYETGGGKSYVGIAEPITFEISGATGNYTIVNWSNPNDPPEQNMTDNDTDPTDGKNWAEYVSPYQSGTTIATQMAARINVYNKPFTLQVKKVHGISGVPLGGVEFALHKDYMYLGTLQESLEALPGYTSLVTGADGVIPRIDETLVPLQSGHYYYLRETRPLPGYEGLPEDIKFNVSDTGVISCANPQYLDEHETVIGNTLHIIYTISLPNVTALDYYFDIEKIAFADKNIHANAGDPTQKFLFRIDRFSEDEETFKTSNILDTFYVTVNCEDELIPNGTGFTLGGAPYNYTLYTEEDNSARSSQYIQDGNSVKIKKKYDRTQIYTYPAEILHGVQTVHVRQSGIYRVTEITDWSSTDYDFWKGSNILKGGDGTAPIGQGASCTTNGNPSVIFSVTDIKAADYENASYEDPITLVTTYRPTASFTNSETEYAYLSAQAYAENSITCKPKQQGGG